MMRIRCSRCFSRNRKTRWVSMLLRIISMLISVRWINFRRRRKTVGIIIIIIGGMLCPWGLVTRKTKGKLLLRPSTLPKDVCLMVTILYPVRTASTKDTDTTLVKREREAIKGSQVTPHGSITRSIRETARAWLSLRRYWSKTCQVKTRISASEIR